MSRTGWGTNISIEHITMKKDLEATISYWHDPRDGSLPDPEHDTEIIMGHWDEENRKMHIKDIRGTEWNYSLDVHGFAVRTLPRKERDITGQDIVGASLEKDVTDQQRLEGEYFQEVSAMIKEVFVNLIHSLVGHI
jgi:hypothetical protein